MIAKMSLYNELGRIIGMKTSEIINNICSQLGIAKAELASVWGYTHLLCIESYPERV